MSTDKKSKQSQLKSLASKGHGINRSKHLKYGDFTESDVHEGPTSYRGASLPDSPMTNRNTFALHVARSGGGKKAFILQGKLYKFSNQDRSGMSSTHSEQAL
jgi:hypothetical protein